MAMADCRTFQSTSVQKRPRCQKVSVATLLRLHLQSCISRDLPASPNLSKGLSLRSRYLTRGSKGRDCGAADSRDSRALENAISKGSIPLEKFNSAIHPFR